MYNFNDYNNQYMYKQPQLQQYQQPQFQQPQYQQVQTALKQQDMLQQSNVNWIAVSGIEDAKSRIVQPNFTLWMLDNNSSRFYVKTSDNFGVTTFKVFEFREMTEDNEQQIKNEYVTKDEIEQIIEQKINDLAEKELRDKTREG